MNSGVWSPKILGALALPQALSLNCPLDQSRVDEHQVVLQQLATVLQSQVGRLKKSREILKLWSAQSRCKGWLTVPYKKSTKSVQQLKPAKGTDVHYHLNRR
jgi:hypothetical protein